MWSQVAICFVLFMPAGCLRLAPEAWPDSAVKLNRGTPIAKDANYEVTQKRTYTFNKLLKRDHVSIISANAGLYKDAISHPEFKDVVLVTAANMAYKDVLDNWQCHADRLGLKYLIIAMDEELYAALDPKHAILVNGTFIAGEESFRQAGFNTMSCNKLKMVTEIQSEIGLDVVFSDPDNVFRKDPFAQGVSLGDKMRTKTFDYIYQQNHGQKPTQDVIAQDVKEGNTGFYYVASGKLKGVQGLFQQALEQCAKHPEIDDQTNFWNAVKEMRTGKRTGDATSAVPDGLFKCANLCNKGATCEASAEEILNYCEMDPFSHTTGWAGPADNFVTYHANYCVGKKSKIAKLIGVGLWDSSCILQPQV